MLIAAAIAWSMRSTEPKGESAPGLSEIATNGGKTAPSTIHPTPAVKTSRKPAASGNVESWDDSLDQEIEMAGLAIHQVQQEQLASAAASGRVEYQLESLKKDIEDSPL